MKKLSAEFINEDDLIEIKDLRIQAHFDLYINLHKEFVEKRENNCNDLLFFCSQVLIMWDSYQKNVKLYGENYL